MREKTTTPPAREIFIDPALTARVDAVLGKDVIYQKANGKLRRFALRHCRCAWFAKDKHSAKLATVRMDVIDRDNGDKRATKHLHLERIKVVG